MFERVAACLGNLQCPKRIVNDYDVLVSIISNFKRRNISVYVIILECIVICEKLIVSLIIPVDEKLLIAFLLWVLITYVTNRAQTYYKTKPSIALDSEVK